MRKAKEIGYAYGIFEECVFFTFTRVSGDLLLECLLFICRSSKSVLRLSFGKKRSVQNKAKFKKEKKSNNIRVHITSCFKIYLNYSRSKIQFSIGNHLMRATEITLCPQCKILSRFVCFWYSFLHLLHIYNTFELIFE